MRPVLALALSLFLTACAENYYACRGHGGALDYCGFATRPPPSGAVVGFVSL